MDGTCRRCKVPVGYQFYRVCPQCGVGDPLLYGRWTTVTLVVAGALALAWAWLA